MNWDMIAAIGQKIGLIAVVAIVVYFLLKALVAFLANMIAGLNKTEPEPSIDPVETKELGEGVPGLHVVSDFTREYRFVDGNPNVETIRSTIRSLDWVEGFHHVVVVTSPGVSLTVSGSLHPEDGLAAAYIDSTNDVYRYPSEPPRTVKDIEELLVSFHLGDGRWEQTYDFD